MIVNPTEKELGFFNEKFIRLSSEECWLWTGYKMKTGHGQFRYRGKTLYAYRFAYMLKHGELDDNICILHKCDKGECVNPDHLFTGTRTDNANDKVIKGRVPNGTLIGGVLTEKDVLEIRKLCAEGRFTQKYIGKQFGVSPSQVGRIASGRRWGHLREQNGTILAII